MAAVGEVLAAQSGPYRWGVRDCLTTAADLVERLTGTRPDCSAWHVLTEPRAIIGAKLRHGSVGAAYAAELAELPGVDELPGGSSLLPGDIVWLEGRIEVAGQVWDTGERCSLIGFVAEYYDILQWMPWGLARITGDGHRVERVFRCRRP